MDKESLDDKFNANVNQCQICFDKYDKHHKRPLIICRMHHTICQSCLNDLQTQKKCPFCRQVINLNKISVNSYIFPLLPNRVIKPNLRMQAQNQNPIMIRKDAEQQNNDDEDYVQILSEAELEQVQSTFAWENCKCWRYIQSKLQLSNNFKRKVVYFIILLTQIPYIFFDFYFASTVQDPICMDTPHKSKIFVVRPWLFGTGVTQLTLMVILITGAALFMWGDISLSNLKGVEVITLLLWTVKNGLWIFMDIGLLSAVSDFCSGGVFIYLVGQLVIIGVAIMSLCCCEINRAQ